MNVYTLLLIGLGVSVDSLAASITTGAFTTRIRLKGLLKVAVYMSVFQAVMPLIGWLIGGQFKHIVVAYDHWIALILLIMIGGKMIYEGISEKEEPKNGITPDNHLMLAGMALATSIDALVIGISFALIEINIALAVLIIGLTTFSFSATGVLIGKKIGTCINKGIEIAGGGILIVLGLKIFISHVFM